MANCIRLQGHRFLHWLLPLLVIATNAHATDNILFAISMTPLVSPVIIAQQQGFFAAQGLSVSLDPYIGGHRTAAAMLDGKAHLATSSEAVVMFNSFQRNDFAVIASIVDSDNDVKILTTKQSGITTVADLQNRRVGTILGTSAHYFLEHTLQLNNVDVSSVKLQNITPEQTPLALKNGELDAVVSWEPFIYQTSKQLGEQALIVPHEHYYLETFNVVVLRQWAEQNAVAIDKILMALQQAITFIQQNDVEAQNIVAAFLQKPIEVITATWQDLNFSLSLHQSLLVTLEDEARWAVNNQLVNSVIIPNYLDYLIIEPLHKINHSAVTIIQ